MQILSAWLIGLFLADFHIRTATKKFTSIFKNLNTEAICVHRYSSVVLFLIASGFNLNSDFDYCAVLPRRQAGSGTGLGIIIPGLKPRATYISPCLSGKQAPTGLVTTLLKFPIIDFSLTFPDSKP